MKYFYPIFICILLFISCGRQSDSALTEEGVSLELARWRKARYSDIDYTLWFNIPEDISEPVRGRMLLRVELAAPEDIILDFTGEITDLNVSSPTPQGGYTYRDQHIVIPKERTVTGVNQIEIEFIPQDQSLNRRDEFLYTLLVPDRARTLFPCFDQPDLKAEFTLSLTVPDGWVAVGNGKMSREEEVPGGKRVFFYRTELIPTYLFSFVAGRFDKVTRDRDGRTVNLYHRETDPAKISQCGQIMDEVYQSLEWLEEFTDMPYPFGKYDLIIVPGFQYGGMEHMGATLYSDRRMLLESNATEAERLARSSLIAHETAHMWFGDFVTMKWFDEVWTKEVFANWFAAAIVGPMYPEINHDLNFIRSYIPPAYTEDRSAGSVPIRQQLDNLSFAGLVYGNIIYNKSPVVMEMLIKKIGYDNFRDGIRQYLRDFAYSNADWNDLIGILDNKTDEDLRTWSRTWVESKGMPVTFITLDGNKVELKQTDPWGRDIFWPQALSMLAVNDAGDVHRFGVEFTGPEVTVAIPEGYDYIVPNVDGTAYGLFVTDRTSTGWLIKNWSDLLVDKKEIEIREKRLRTIDFTPMFWTRKTRDARPATPAQPHPGQREEEIARLATLINLNECMLNGYLDPSEFFEFILTRLFREPNLQIYRLGLSYAEKCMELFIPDRTRQQAFVRGLTDELWCEADPDKVISAMQVYSRTAILTEADYLFNLWKHPDRAWEYYLGPNDLTDISYRLAVHFPDRAEEIITTQLARITNPDRRKEYQYISKAVLPDRERRDSVFNALLQAENRTVEPWAASVIRLLNDPARYPVSLDYLLPGLGILTEIQRTGDIFFPANWSSALLSGHTSPEALAIMERFLDDNPEYPPLLRSKILQRGDHLYIANGKTADRYLR